LKEIQRFRAFVFFLFAIFALGNSPFLRSQEETGTVKPDSVSVYAEASKDSDVVATLQRGKSVRITLSITNGEGIWCSISDAENATKLGFVGCDALDRKNVPSAAASSGGTPSSLLFDASVSNQPPSRAQQRWALAASAILSTYNHERLDTLSPGGDVLGTRRLIQNSWDIGSHDQLLQTLDWIDQGGHRQLFSALGARAVQLTPDQLAQSVSQLSPEDANSVLMARRYYPKYATQSITAWDYARYINVCRWGVATGYISEAEAWPRVMHAAQILQNTFSSWKEFGENYIVGREFWSLRQTKIDGQAMRSIYQALLNNSTSPWNRIPWDLPLQEASASQPTSPVPPATGLPAKQSGSCEAFERAASGGQQPDVEAFLKDSPELINCRDSRGWTPLHHAAFNGQAAMISTLVAHGATVDATDKDGSTALHAAASAGSPDAIEALLQNKAKIDAPDHEGNSPLQDAVDARSSAAIEALLKHHAAMDGHNRAGYSPLGNAAWKGQVEMVRLLLDNGANIESRGNDGYTPLNVAAWSGQSDVVELLLAANANVNTKANDGTTPLQAAAAKGYVDIARLLLERGAHVNTGNTHGFTPLHTAANNDQAEVAELLIAHGADMNARTNDGDTPLHWAARDGRMNTARLLLAKGAQVSPADKDGNTPLHWAAARGQIAMTELLIAHGADLKAKTRWGCTPLRGAYDFHQELAAQVLLKHGATQ
jgi:ankyrin repeat protein